MAKTPIWPIEGVALGSDAAVVANSLADQVIKIKAVTDGFTAGDIAAIKAVTDLIPNAGAMSDIATAVAKIDSAAVSGLSGTADSLAYKVAEIEDHFHTREYWYGKDPGDGFLLENGLVSWQVTAGAGGAFGNWLQLSNGDEIVAGTKYDPHKILITTTSTASKLYYIQLGIGNLGAQVVQSQLAMYPAASLRQSATLIVCPRIASTAKLWARCACETDGATANFVIGLHVYPA